jgi:hypothetical protein
MSKKEIIHVQGAEVSLLSHRKEDYISLTDIAKYRNALEPFSIINNWMRSRGTIEFIGLWEQLNNPDFKPIEFEWFIQLNQTARTPMQSLLNNQNLTKRLK